MCKLGQQGEISPLYIQTTNVYIWNTFTIIHILRAFTIYVFMRNPRKLPSFLILGKLMDNFLSDVYPLELR